MFGRCSFVMLYVFLALALLSGCALTYAASGFASLAAVWQVPVFFLGCFLALVVLFLLVVLVSCLFVDPKKLLEKPSGYFRFLLNEFCRIALALGGVHVNVTGLEKVPRKGRFLLVSNHRFAFDPIVFYAVMPWAELAFLSKKENFSIFIVAQVMREVLCLPVDRNNDRESLKSILKAIQFIKDDKASIAVFPEGGTNKTDAPLLPYRSGVFKIAQKANVPIVVCSLVNSRAILHNMFRKHTESGWTCWTSFLRRIWPEKRPLRSANASTRSWRPGSSPVRRSRGCAHKASRILVSPLHPAGFPV